MVVRSRPKLDARPRPCNAAAWREPAPSRWQAGASYENLNGIDGGLRRMRTPAMLRRSWDDFPEVFEIIELPCCCLGADGLRHPASSCGTRRLPRRPVAGILPSSCREFGARIYRQSPLSGFGG